MKHKQIIVCITCDVEVKSKENIRQLETIVSLLNKYDVKSTFFIEITQKNVGLYAGSKILSSLNNEGHELGLHIHWGNMGSYTKGMENISLKYMQYELESSLKLAKEIGFKPTSFRGGGLCCTNTSLRLIMEYGFKVDSSVAAKLNEGKGWFQGHNNVPYRSWYYPSKQSYDMPAFSPDDRLGILEVPVTRMIPSGREWFPWTLTPTSPFFRFIVNEWVIKSRWEPVTVITPIFHSWGEWKLREKKFPLFLDKLEKMIRFLKGKNFEFKTLRELREITWDIEY